jgi:hypothetical protein
MLHRPGASLHPKAEPPRTATPAPLDPLDTAQPPHQRRVPPRSPCRRPRLLLQATTAAPHRLNYTAMEPPAPVSTSSSSTPYQVHHRPDLLPGHSTVDHQPPTDWILLASRRHQRGEELPYFLVVGQKAICARLLCQARPGASVDPSPLQ